MKTTKILANNVGVTMNGTGKSFLGHERCKSEKRTYVDSIKMQNSFSSKETVTKRKASGREKITSIQICDKGLLYRINNTYISNKTAEKCGQTQTSGKRQANGQWTQEKKCSRLFITGNCKLKAQGVSPQAEELERQGCGVPGTIGHVASNCVSEVL